MSCDSSFNCDIGLTCGKEGVCTPGVAGEACSFDKDCDGELTSMASSGPSLGLCTRNGPSESRANNSLSGSTPASKARKSITRSNDTEVVYSANCLGRSSWVGVKSVDTLIAEHGELRRQWHPIRLFLLNAPARVPMLCYTSASGDLCATAKHVVQFKERTIHMEEFCDSHQTSPAG